MRASDDDLKDVLQIIAERERMNTLTLASVSAMCRDILAELRKPAPEDSPLVQALEALVDTGRRQEELLARHARALDRIEAALVSA